MWYRETCMYSTKGSVCRADHLQHIAQHLKLGLTWGRHCSPGASKTELLCVGGRYISLKNVFHYICSYHWWELSIKWKFSLSLYSIQYFALLEFNSRYAFLNYSKTVCCIRLYKEVILLWKIRKLMTDDRKL